MPRGQRRNLEVTRDWPPCCVGMDEVEAANDNRRPAPGKKKSRGRRLVGSVSRKKSRQHLATRGDTAHRPGRSTATASPRDMNGSDKYCKQEADTPQPRASRMRGHASSSSSVPRRISFKTCNTDIKSARGKDDNETTEAVRETNESADDEDRSQEGIFGRRKTNMLSADDHAIDVVISDHNQVGPGCQVKKDVEDEDAARLLESQNQQAESCRRHLEHRCEQLEGEMNLANAELKSYKAEMRAKTIAVGKAEIILNEICLLMVRRLGRAEGTQLSDSKKGGVLLEVHQTPAEFAAQIKKNILAQLSKWEIDRAALQALAQRAGDEAADAAKVQEAKRMELSEHVEQLEDSIHVMKFDSQRLLEKAQAVGEENRKECQAVSSANEVLAQELATAARRNGELYRAVQENEQEFQVQLDRFMEYPKASERMADELDRCKKSARREKNLMSLERKEFRRQLHIFQKWQVENKELREKAKRQEMQVLALRRQLASTEAGLAGSASSREAVIGGTVDRLQRAETAAKHQAQKYRELAGARGVQVAQLETELSSHKATIKNLQHLLEPPVNDSYEAEVARFARVNPEVLEVQQRSGLDEDDMEASMAQLLLLREKEGQKDALIALARERDEFELRVKELRSRNAWLEKEVLKSPEALRSVAKDRVATLARCEKAKTCKRLEPVSNGLGWIDLSSGHGKREISRAPISQKDNNMSIPDDRVGVQEGRLEPGGELTARIRRNIRFLEECDQSIEKQREHETTTISKTDSSKHQGGSGVIGGGTGGRASVAAARAVRGNATQRQRPRSAQGISRGRPFSSGEGDTRLIGVPEVTSVPRRGLFHRRGHAGFF